MATLDKQADISPALALEFEGAAIIHDMESEEFLRYLLDNWARKTKTNRETNAIREVIRERHAEGATDTDIGREVGKSQQAISALRAGMGLESNYRGRPSKKRVRL